MRKPRAKPKRSGLHGYLEDAQTHRCCLCGDGTSARCTDGPDVGYRLVVAARGNRDEVALVPVAVDDRARVGCPDLRSLVLLRDEAFHAEDHALAAAVAGAGGRLWIASSFEAGGVRAVLASAVMVLSWEACDVFSVVDAAVSRAGRRPATVVADATAPDYGRWPVPAVPWVSIESRIAWDREPFRVYSRRRDRERLLGDAVATSGLPTITEEENPLTQALALAALLRTLCLERPDALRLTPVRPFTTVIGICQGRAYGLERGRWEPVFRGGGSDAGVTLLEIEQANAHARMAAEVLARYGGMS